MPDGVNPGKGNGRGTPIPNNLEQLIADKKRLFDIGARSAKRIGINVRVAALRAINNGLDVPYEVLTELSDLKPVIAESMVAAHLSGRLRSTIVASEHFDRGVVAFGPYESAVDFVKRRLNLDKEHLNTIRSRYGSAAVDVTEEVGGAVGTAASNAVVDIVEQGLTTSESIKYMREVMDGAGVDVTNPWLLETMVRSQIAVAYSAGRWNANQDPAIQEILWGYEYVTVGDDRVRFTHEAIDGAAYPKEHPFWETNWPPNGYNCRCDVLELFKDEAPVVVEKQGEADEGWAVNHDLLVGTI